MSKILQGGRIPHASKDVVSFISSIKSDRRLLQAVIKINQAHVVMMMEEEIINWTQGSKILEILKQLSDMKLKPSTEDVHMAVEEEVLKRGGSEVGGNLHIAKSRNDQVSTAIRMELREILIRLMSHLFNLQQAIIKLAEKHVRTILLGYTHLQPAQPITLAHHLLSYVDSLERDLQRLEECYKRVNLCPMGSGALATSSFPVNRERLAELLGFTGILENSMDAVGSRDFILETLAGTTITAMDISRIAEDLILWSCPDFGIIELPDSYSSTSSIMPQKKNPDVLEVIRARTSHLLGNFVTSATTLKSLPSSYNLDLQEITPRLWESLGKIINSLKMLTQLFPKLKVSQKTFKKELLSFSASTELANFLVREKGVPFRTAHKIVGSLVRVLKDSNLTFFDVTSELLQEVIQDHGLELEIETEDIKRFEDPIKLVEAYQVKGGPSPVEVEKMIFTRKEWIERSQSQLSVKKLHLKEAKDNLQSVIDSYSSKTEIMEED
ncbi:MAG: argininosuccinate lyase [Thermoproteota archaeon]